MNTKRKLSLFGLLFLFIGMLSINSVLLAAAPCDPHTPLDCNVIIKTLPYDLTFNADVPGTLLDKAASNLGTGFSMSLPATTPFVGGDAAAPSYVKANLTVNTTTGQLEIVSTKGLNVGASDSQNNALGIGLAAPVAGTIVLDTTIVNLDLTAESGMFQQAGIWFGIDDDNYIKFVVADGGGAGTYLETIQEIGGTLGTSVKSAGQNEATLAGGTLRMVLTLVPGGTSTMQYSVNGGTLVNAGAGTYSVSNTLFNGIATKEGAITSFAGVMASHRNGVTPITAKFDYFSVRTAPNVPPTAVNNNYTMDEDTTLTVNAPGVLANDTDPTNDPLTAVLVAGPTNEQAFTLNADGSFSYTPVADFFGPDTFTYRVSDGLSLSANTATVTITVDDVEETTVAVDDDYEVDEDDDLIVSTPGVLDNDIAVGAGTAEVVTPPTSAQSFTLQNNGRLEYTPLPNFSGTDTFTYQIEDGVEISNIATVTITVNAINDPPVAGADDYDTTLDTALVVNVGDGVLSNDTDADDDDLAVSGVQTDVTNGTLDLEADGSFTYTPDLGFLGEDSFVYEVTDGTVTVTGTATITVVNDVVELLDNGGFEAAGTTGKSASKWVGSKLLTGDRRICTNKGVTDACAFRFQFKGSTNFIRQITQVYKTPITVSVGDSVTLGAFVRANKMAEGASVQIIVQYTDNTKATGSILIPAGTYAYTEFTREIDLDKNVKKITVRVRYNGRLGNGGTFFVDDITLLLSQTGALGGLVPTGLVPVPAAPADLRGN